MIKNSANFEKYLATLCLLANVPLLILAVALQLYLDISIWIISLTVLFAGLLVLWCSYRIYTASAFQFRNLHNLLDAMNEGDFSLRIHSQAHTGAYSDLVNVINQLSTTLSEQRRKTAESQVLLSTVIEQIDVAIISVNQAKQIELLNPKAKVLFAENKKNAELDQLLYAASNTIAKTNLVQLDTNGKKHKFRWMKQSFRRDGAPHQLFFLTDVEHLLREEEINAWQKLVRVISHEINNSLAPICSISQMLNKQVELHLKNSAPYEHLSDGLNLISDRASTLTQFINSYQQLNKLPEPNLCQHSVLTLVEKTATLFKNQCKVKITNSIDTIALFDPTQIEQVMINLLKNAVEAMTNCRSEQPVEVNWSETEHDITINVIDAGCGLQNSQNLFVPFYSTKPQGSGIGLVLCRQIVEAHGGQLTLINRQEQSGCIASFTIPK